MKFVLGVLVCGVTLLGERVFAEEAKLDRAKALEELKGMEEKNEKLTHDLLEKAAKELTEAGLDKFKAVQVYLESYRNVEFGRAQDGETRFQRWRVENKGKIGSLDFSEGAQLHVQYVALVCREALGKKEAPKAEEWGVYWENLFQSQEIAESPGDLGGKGADGEKRWSGAKAEEGKWQRF